MIFDSDILIWALRGNARAAGMIERAEDRAISIVSLMELLQRARSKHESREVRRFIELGGFHVFPLSESIGYLALGQWKSTLPATASSWRTH
jgi:predicted nucleic acid-binding protein